MLIGINAQKLFVTQDYRNAGISRYIGQLARHLPEVAGPECYRLYTNQHVRRWPGVEGPRLRVLSTPLPTTQPLLRILWEQTVLPVLALRDGIDLLHCPLNIQPVLCRAPVVLTIHDLTFVRFPDRFHPLKQRYLARLTRFSARRARRILADSAATKRDVEETFGIPPSKIDVVYPAVDPDFRPFDRTEGRTNDRAVEAFRRRKGLPERFILYLGTLEPRKNVDKLVTAYAAAARRGLPHALVLAGGKGWNYQAIFQAVERHGLADRVLFPGYVDRADQPLWYNAAELFVYPSQYEGFGLPALEAMACGVPVVTSNTSSLPEVVGSAGATVDPTDVGALSEMMVAVLSDAGRMATMRLEGRRQAAGFTWRAAAEACVAAYRVANSPGAGEPSLVGASVSGTPDVSGVPEMSKIDQGARRWPLDSIRQVAG
ncbi:MAG: glycosyltransferase family 4 protein [Chloroflexota bacterium]|nr:glycosyltransferase family 4 protein [Chloroflexota bacterium]